ncbi:MAG: endonuclease [Bacteroidales bacterium]|nr:endonuclease [Bacteroidales bacterium]
MNTSRYLILTCLLVCLQFVTTCIEAQNTLVSGAERGDLRIMFYNVENYFDTLDDPHKRDNDFLPDADKKWNGYRYYEKSQHIFQVVAAVGELEPPELIGLCELENEATLQKLIWSTGLSKFPYRIVQYESPDLRGIDVGLLYRSDRMELVSSEPHTIRFPNNPRKKTRDILYGKFLCNTKDTLHIFVNHWPSRYGGQEESDPARRYVAGILRHKTDSLLAIDPCAAILIMGDLNDGPTDPSIRESLGAIAADGKAACANLYNLSIIPVANEAKGTHRYKANWETFDQFIVSGSLLNKKKGRLYSAPQMHIADFSFLLEPDKTYGGVKPNRSYFGSYYHGGFSDHLPVFLDIYFR